jgi:hypothetical protein
MIANQQILLFIIKREPISLLFKDIFCFQSSLKYISPFLQNILVPLEYFAIPEKLITKLKRGIYLGE